MSESEPSPPRARPQFETLIGRALRLRCPRCGEGRLFTGWMHMPPKCAVCGLKFERGPGYYLGSTYVSYGFTAATMSAMFLVGRIFFNIPGRTLLVPLVAYAVLVPVIFFRHARALWLALDCVFDSSVLEDEDDA